MSVYIYSERHHIWDDFFCQSEEESLAFAHEHQFVHLLEHQSAGLVDGCDDDSAIRSQRFEDADDLERVAAVQARSRLIQH